MVIAAGHGFKVSRTACRNTSDGLRYSAGRIGIEFLHGKLARAPPPLISITRGTFSEETRNLKLAPDTLPSKVRPGGIIHGPSPPTPRNPHQNLSQSLLKSDLNPPLLESNLYSVYPFHSTCSSALHLLLVLRTPRRRLARGPRSSHCLSRHHNSPNSRARGRTKASSPGFPSVPLAGAGSDFS